MPSANHHLPRHPDDHGWDASLELGLHHRLGRTVLGELRHQGPLRVQRPFYPEGDLCCHLYLLHPPGGMVTGDRLQVDVRLGANTQALVTTPSAGKIYRGDLSTRPQQQHCRLHVADDAVLEWLPQETIVFDGARGELCTEIHLAASAQFLLWDIVCLGRPAAGERFRHGYVVQKLQVRRSGRWIYHERNCFAGGSTMLENACGMQDYPVSGSMLASITLSETELADLRDSVNGMDLPGITAITQMDGVLLVRHIGAASDTCRFVFEQVWDRLRPHLNQRQASSPRIWQT